MRRLSKHLQWIVLADLILFVTSVLAVAINSLKYGFHIDYTISRYVGLETWSAIVFGLGNVMVAYLSFRFLMWIQVRGKVPKWLMLILAGIFVVGLLGLSACPMGYFDEPGSPYGSSVPSFIHNRCSRIMFFSMLVLAAVIAAKLKLSKKMQIALAAYIIYGLFCVLAFLGHVGWFGQGILVFESSYIFGFFGVCLGCGKEMGNKKVKKEENGRTEGAKQ